MEFRILGPLEVVSGGRAVPLGGPRTRATLAALLLADQQVVPIDRLVGLVWGDDPPSSVRGQVAIAVSKLRKVLPGAIETVGSGYRLPAVRLDARVAEARIMHARLAAPSEAAEGLRGALAMWRGPVLAGLGEVAASADRWEQLRLDVHEEWVSLELGLGRHGEVIGELTTFVGENPLREGARAQLMVALHRCGRRADALEVYREGCSVLGRELGVGPGAQLRAALDPILSPAVRRAAPASISGFAGRTRELARLRGLLTHETDGSVPIAAISGPGGAGKTALAVRAGAEVASAFPDGRLYADLRGRTPLEVLEGFLRSLGATDLPADAEEAANRYRSLTAGRRVLVMLDDADDPAQVRPLLPSGAGCAVIVTSRQILATLEGAAHLYLSGGGRGGGVGATPGECGEEPDQQARGARDREAGRGVGPLHEQAAHHYAQALRGGQG